MTSLSWEALTLRIAARLPRLQDRDTIILFYRPWFTQLQQFEDRYVQVEAAAEKGTGTLLGLELRPEQEFRLAEIGWLAPDQSESFNWWARGYSPLSGREALRLTRMMVTSMRDVYGVTDPGQIELTTFNAYTGEPLW